MGCIDLRKVQGYFSHSVSTDGKQFRRVQMQVGDLRVSKPNSIGFSLNILIC